MRIVPLGDSALLADLGPKADDATAAAVFRLAASLRSHPLPGVTAVVPSFTTVAVHFRPEAFARGTDAGATVAGWMGRAGSRGPSGQQGKPRKVTLPVSYDAGHGEDLADLAKALKLSPAEIAKRHAKAEYAVRAVGFSPGFPYLAGLPKELHHPRRATPRTRVPAGSVAIGGAQTGVYPSETPGGWNLIGRTPARLFDPASPEPALLRVGDRVRFEAIDRAEFDRRAAEQAPRRPRRPSSDQEPAFSVVRPGLQTTVQDLGRPGWEESGVGPGGAADALALRVGNLLLGNAEDAAGLECALQGPVLVFRRDAWVAVTGARVRYLPWARPFKVAGGTVLSMENIEAGCRAYLCLAGGIEVPEVLGSRSTALASGFGGYAGRALAAGDELALGEAAALPRPAGNWFVGPSLAPDPAGQAPIRVMRGGQADGFRTGDWASFVDGVYRISPRSDRMGLRLEGGPGLALAAKRDMVSEAVATGSIQVPPDGQPIILLADRQTIGGYPKLASVATVDLARLAQKRPGDEVRFTVITVAAARRLLIQREDDLAWLRLALGYAPHRHA